MTNLADVQTIFDLIMELATYEKATSGVVADPDLLAKTLAFQDSNSTSPDAFSSGYARTFLLIAPEGEVAGMALYFYNFSTWTGKPGVYLEDLFVKPKYRKRGYGKALIRACAKEVVRINGTRLEWSCLDWNQPSLDFYESLGAISKKEWVGLRLEGDALGKVANADK
jgi:GNAT superfamily N-acetyltransferase